MDLLFSINVSGLPAPPGAPPSSSGLRKPRVAGADCCQAADGRQSPRPLRRNGDCLSGPEETNQCGEQQRHYRLDSKTGSGKRREGGREETSRDRANYGSGHCQPRKGQLLRAPPREQKKDEKKEG